ncbi:XkdF-like putative serine protease domain-containing protein [Bacillus sp. L381]|uniref:XkdF-like putative serine protease domain-containing protein n=1 Tax=Bacillus TaxID=1386 RepID=UPI001BACE7B5|nr:MULTISPECIES: XkdF-like putative serine protease domain-containing protein [Bacillus]MCR9037786.1 XkdF-like putative serine protease domain-containing protein [Bacillus velezensis]QUN10700.1 phage portal protein [Bacillus amyloliquefaciens]QYM83832.1 phage portal protein [Bacillus sp. 7D3]QZY13019.1 phage portal protein [Bacillus amyloliquefaciens]WIX22832.1 XkdF-like putative serine protease domain-containing protein [Bacillus sp. L381]
MPRELRNAVISFVSYVDKAANQTEFFFTKAAGIPSFEKKVQVFTKSEPDEQKLVYGIVYEPDVPDAHGDYMTAEEIEKAAHGFLADARNIDTNHNFEGGTGEVVESYVAPDDFEIGNAVIRKGSWVLVTKASDEVWDQIKAGVITGYSMAGTADVYEEPEEKQAGLFGAVKQFLDRDRKSRYRKGEDLNKMRKEDIRESIEHALHPLLKRLDSLDQNTDDKDGATATSDEEKLKTLVEDMLAPIIKRIEALEKVRGASKQPEEETSGQEPVKKSIWSGLL